jgi:hypothetical protein
LFKLLFVVTHAVQAQTSFCTIKQAELNEFGSVIRSFDSPNVNAQTRTNTRTLIRQYVCMDECVHKPTHDYGACVWQVTILFHINVSYFPIQILGRWLFFAWKIMKIQLLLLAMVVVMVAVFFLLFFCRLIIQHFSTKDGNFFRILLHLQRYEL